MDTRGLVEFLGEVVLNINEVFVVGIWWRAPVILSSSASRFTGYGHECVARDIFRCVWKGAVTVFGSFFFFGLM